MSKKRIIMDKKFLNSFNNVIIGFENCDVFEVDVADILDFYCVAKSNGSIYVASDGFIKISDSASDVIEWCCKETKSKLDSDCFLKSRLKTCEPAADISSFLLKNQLQTVEIAVPYAPLESVLSGGEIELTNCPSLEIDEGGNMIIRFGESSKQPRRKDNNYSEIILGWKDYFGEYSPKRLTVKAESLSTFGENRYNLSFEFSIRDKKCQKDYAQLVFMDVKDYGIETYFSKVSKCELQISRLKDGRIYVGIMQMGIEFTCAEIVEYEYYCQYVPD